MRFLKYLILAIGVLGYLQPSIAAAQDYNAPTGAATVDDQNDLEARAGTTQEGFTLTQDGDVYIEGVVDLVTNDSLTLSVEGDDIRVNVGNIPQSEEFLSFIEEGMTLAVRGKFDDSASVIPVIDAKTLRRIKRDIR